MKRGERMLSRFTNIIQNAVEALAPQVNLKNQKSRVKLYFRPARWRSLPFTGNESPTTILKRVTRKSPSQRKVSVFSTRTYITYRDIFDQVYFRLLGQNLHYISTIFYLQCFSTNLELQVGRIRWRFQVSCILMRHVDLLEGPNGRNNPRNSLFSAKATPMYQILPKSKCAFRI